MLVLEKITTGYALIFDDDTALKVDPEAVSGCAEGDVIKLCGDRFVTDIHATQKRRQQIKALQDSLWDD